MTLPLHVIIFGPSEKFLSGINYYTIRLSNALAEKTDVTAILFRHMLPKKLFPGWRRVGAKLSSLSFSDGIKKHEILDWYNPITWLRGYRIAKKGNIILFEWWTSSVAIIYLSIAFLNFGRIPIIIEYHEIVDPLEHANIFFRNYSRISGLILRKCAAQFVTHSEADRELVSRIYRMKKEKIEVIPHGLYDQYQRIEKTVAKSKLMIADTYVILFFGLLRPYKGVKYLIQAFNSLPPELIERSRLFIVGETWEDQETVSFAELSPHKEKISIINRYISDEEIQLFFSVSDVLVLPYTRASQSGVAHIGMAYGMPIIASDVGGIREALQLYQGARIMPPEQPEEIRKKIIEVLNEQMKYRPPVNLEWNKIADKWVELISRLLLVTYE